MAINMKINIGWSIVLNTSSYEWHELQHPIAKIMEKQFSHLLSYKFEKIENFEHDQEILGLFAKFNKDYSVELIVVKEGEIPPNKEADDEK